MGRKIHPKLFRLQTIYSWDSKWFARKGKYADLLREDVLLREFVREQLKTASVDEVLIDRNANKITLTITSAKPGLIIGRAGSGIEELKKAIMKKLYAGKRVTLNINVKEVHNPSLSARVIGQQIASEVERRMPFRRSMKSARQRAMEAGAKGIKIQVSGRLNGADIARSETISEGSIPLHNLRADVDYARVTARTIWGAIGVKVWVYNGEVFEGKVEERKIERAKPSRSRNPRNRR